MLLLCLSWGFNQIAVKLVLPDIPPFLQGLFRSCGALLVILLVALFRGVQAVQPRRHAESGSILRPAVRHRIRADLSRPAADDRASRAVVFLYTAPFFVALGSYHWFLGERLRAGCNGAGWR